MSDGEAEEGAPRVAETTPSPFRAADPDSLLQRALPVAKELPGYRVNTLRIDLIAALTVAALAVPAAMAYAEVAGLDPIVGLYALLAPPVAYALLGSSRQLIVGPEGSVSALVAVSVLAMASAGSPHAAELAATLALMVAICFVIARLIRIGWIADYFSRPVLVGYIHGVAVVLVIGQLGKLLGLKISASEPLPQLAEVFRELGSVSGTTLLVSVCALAVLLPLRFLAPKIPAALVVVILGIVASSLLDLKAHGVAVVGTIPSGLPSITIPRPSMDEIAKLAPAALGLFLVSFSDEVLTARSFAGRHNQHIRVGQELLAMGAANAAAGVTQGLPIGASGSRTAVNDDMGARSQISGLLSAAIVTLVLLFLTGPIGNLPKAVLGAVIVGACVGLVEPAAWRELWNEDRAELGIAAATAGGVILVGVLNAILFAVALSIFDVVRRSARPHDAVLGWDERLGRWADVSNHRKARTTPGVVVYRLDDRLFFANAGYVKGRVREALRAAQTPTHTLVFDAEGMTHIDTTAMDALETLSESLAEDGITLRFARVNGPVQRRLDSSAVAAHPERFHGTVRAAVEASLND